METDTLDGEALYGRFQTWLGEARDWLESAADTFLSVATLWQVGGIVLAALVGWAGSRHLRARLLRASEAAKTSRGFARFYRSLANIVWPVFSVILIWVATAAFAAFELPNETLRIVASLLNAGIIVRLVTSNMKRGLSTRFIAVVSWGIAALYILHLLGPTTAMLNDAAVDIGDTRISALQVITSLFVAIVGLWIGRIAGNAAQSSLRGSSSLNPSMAGLLGQVAKIGFMGLAIIFAMQAVGIDLSALAIFSGALGVGIGFGLQSIFSNFISGIIILLERSVKVGDFIELQSGVTGVVNEINIRSTLVTTNDNVDILVPNEEFIKAQSINWTLREAKRRMHIKFGVAYGTDKELVRTAGLEAAAAVEWTFDDGKTRAPQVWLVNFGDSSLDFELVVWLKDDAVKRPAKALADYNWAIHTALERHGIEIPFPQRDLHLKAGGPIQVKVSDER